MKQTSLFNKERSIKGCIADSWKVFALHRGRFLKHNALYLLLVGLSGAFVVQTITYYLTHHFLPAFRVHQTLQVPELIQALATPSLPFLLTFLASVLLGSLCLYAFTARQKQLMQVYQEENGFPKKMPLRLSASALRTLRRMIVADLPFIFVCLLATVGISYLAHEVHKAFLIALPLLFIYIGSTAHVARLYYAFQGLPYKSALKQAFCRSMGNLFIVQFLTFIPYLVILSVLCLPIVLFVTSAWAGYDSELRGDGLGLPASFPYLFFLLHTLVIALATLFNSLRTWAVAMK